MTVEQHGSKWAVVTPGGWTAALLDSHAAAWAWIDRYRPTDSTVNSIQTGGYTTFGDGSGATYKRVGSAPSKMANEPVRIDIDVEEDGVVEFTFYRADGSIVAFAAVLADGIAFAHILDGTQTVARERMTPEERSREGGR